MNFKKGHMVEFKEWCSVDPTSKGVPVGHILSFIFCWGPPAPIQQNSPLRLTADSAPQCVAKI
jgi:hypothetical protein